MVVRVFLRRLNIAPRKVRMVAKLIKKMNVVEAEKQLLFSPRRAAKALLKLLKHAIDVAEKRHQLKKEELFIKNIIVNEGPKLKRYIPMSRGHVGQIVRRSSHVELILDKK